MKKLGILVSGRGSNMSSIIDACEQGRISASVEIVLSNNADAKALSIAKERRIIKNQEFLEIRKYQRLIVLLRKNTLILEINQ